MSPQISVPSPASLANALGAKAVSEWFTIDQERVDAFAEATGDHQWIHVDPERAKDGPFGGPIAHGYLTLSLLPMLSKGLFDIGGLAMSVNYGLDRLRFLQPVAVGSRVRAVAELASVEPVNLGVRAGYTVTVEIEDSDKPALVAQTITLYVPELSGGGGAGSRAPPRTAQLTGRLEHAAEREVLEQHRCEAFDVRTEELPIIPTEPAGFEDHALRISVRDRVGADRAHPIGHRQTPLEPPHPSRAPLSYRIYPIGTLSPCGR